MNFFFFKFIFFSTSLLTPFYSNTSYYNESRNYEVIDGYLNVSEMANDEKYQWLFNEEGPYSPSKNVVQKVGMVSNVNYVIFCGTWCEDTRFLLPRYLKIFAEAEIAMNDILIMGVDTNYTTTGNINEFFTISRVPTVIVYHKKKEIGRIVEYGEGNFEENIINILKKVKN